ncbi:MAG: UDP-N-acetylmuramoyl-L-alanine--D-glutamate ligase [Deltaproteobacteria bacterium]|nr:UDP-N-acetylmuramoyl-L-alanine--D-glutamate ligase [Deltaproteobacteria bacterium]MBW2302462.1 UDP-N-acetylmuramoyl-L-alanine--D-glutamate ligase [Deltaproteobacteria bacterium]
MDFAGKRVVVVGLGRSGLSACRWLRSEGAQVLASDIKREEEMDPAFLEEALELGVKVEAGGHRTETFLESDWIIVSPGVPLDMAPLRKAREAGIPVTGEMDLASRLVDVPILGVTGTNGKSTATAFLGFMLERAGRKVFVGGNIGTPLMDFVGRKVSADLAVVEVSSFQLDAMDRFHPALSLILNISPDHLDRYPDYEAYAASKLKIFKNQGPGDYVILNDDDEILARVQPGEGPTFLRYGTERRDHRQAFLEGDRLRVLMDDGKEADFDLGGFALPGIHNRQNLMGCVLAGLVLGVEERVVQESIDRFRGLPHRMEFVGNFQGVDFYDDSKATNVEAAARAVEGFDRPVILIAGGRDKGGDYTALAEASKNRVKAALLMGEAKDLLAKALRYVVPVYRVEDMGEAVQKAFEISDPGDVVLLAPACSSFDMFRDYAQRGEVFKKEARSLGHGR